jgi:hypothetical protein
LKKHIRVQPLPDLAANDNTATTIVRLWRGLPAPHQAALGLALGYETEPAPGAGREA